jgi:hypothetical protein
MPRTVLLPQSINAEHDSRPWQASQALKVHSVAEYARLSSGARGDEMRLYVLPERDRGCEHALIRSKVLLIYQKGRQGLEQTWRVCHASN